MTEEELHNANIEQGINYYELAKIYGFEQCDVS
jgi:predicted oxidoreductase